MPGTSQELSKCASTDTNKAGVIAALEINLRRARKAVLDNNPYAVRGSERGHRARLAIMKERFDLLLAGHIYISSELLMDLAELDMGRSVQYSEREAVL